MSLAIFWHTPSPNAYAAIGRHLRIVFCPINHVFTSPVVVAIFSSFDADIKKKKNLMCSPRSLFVESLNRTDKLPVAAEEEVFRAVVARIKG